MAEKIRRGRLWVNTPFQGRLLLRLLCYFLLYFFIVFHLSFFYQVMRGLVINGTGQATGYSYGEYLWIQVPFLVCFVAVAPVFLYDLVKFSHRVAGPLHRCRNVMQEMADGKPVPEFKPRKDDLMPEFFQTFNALIKRCNAQVSGGESGSLGGQQAAKPGVDVVRPSAVSGALADAQQSAV
jgi:hypothetical protein